MAPCRTFALRTWSKFWCGPLPNVPPKSLNWVLKSNFKWRLGLRLRHTLGVYKKGCLGLSVTVDSGINNSLKLRASHKYTKVAYTWHLNLQLLLRIKSNYYKSSCTYIVLYESYKNMITQVVRLMHGTTFVLISTYQPKAYLLLIIKANHGDWYVIL